MALVKDARPLIRPFLILGKVINGSITPIYVGVTVQMLRSFYRIARKSGIPGLVKFLKVSYVITQQTFAGYVIKDITPLGCRVARTHSGLPRVIPTQVRALMIAGDTNLLRYVLTLLSLYRVLEYPGKLKLGSITDPASVDIDLKFFDPYLSRFTYLFTGEDLHDRSCRLRSARVELVPISTSGPISSWLYSQVLNKSWTPSSSHPISVIIS